MPNFDDDFTQPIRINPNNETDQDPSAEDASGGEGEGQSPPPPIGFRFMGWNFGPRFWTIATITSLLFNAFLIFVVFVLLIMFGLWRGSGSNEIAGLLGNLYTNFEKMDRAHIRTDIPISTQIPVRFDIQINQQTEVVLSQDVSINNVLVSLQTGGLTITRPTSSIVLPAGTRLPINLNLTVPVDQMVPVNMTVPVDIALSQTDLHEPFVGLQGVVKPYLCTVQPNAMGITQEPVCK